jgi:hypothetical protein
MSRQPCVWRFSWIALSGLAADAGPANRHEIMTDPVRAGLRAVYAIGDGVRENNVAGMLHVLPVAMRNRH